MTFVWELKLYEMANGRYRVVIAGDGKTVSGHGMTPHSAFRAADCQLVTHPAFFLPDEPTQTDFDEAVRLLRAIKSEALQAADTGKHGQITGRTQTEVDKFLASVEWAT